MEKKNQKIAFIGNYLPRRCGIATFTTDLCEAVAETFPEIKCFAVPVTDIPEGYNYPLRVRFEIKEQDLDSYLRAADFLNINNPDVVSLQHEYGIFGGEAGSHIISLISRLKMPVVTTLHTILRNPNNHQRRVMEQIVELSEYIVVMTEKAKGFLSEIYHADKTKIRLIPHGIPDVPFIDPNFYKDQYGVSGRKVLLTFGLLSPNKGIETVIRALPRIVKECPDMVFLILGATHPSLIRQEGEFYRIKLQQMAEDLGVTKNVIFYNQFVTIEELKEFIIMADIYITPYLNEEQITSGTLAYSFGAGNAVISTPYYHAAELLAGGRGILVPFRDSQSIAREVIYLLKNENERNALRKQAYLIGREFVWSNIARQYKETFEAARLKKSASRTKFSINLLSSQQIEYPKIKLDYLIRMTDSTGILQHALYNIPNLYEGYCTDDNARALILMILLEKMKEINQDIPTSLAVKYLSFLYFAFDHTTKQFRNFLMYNREWKNENFSEDCHGRALWALGTCIGRSTNDNFRNYTSRIFDQALQITSLFSSPRAWAFILLSLHEYLKRFGGDRLVHNIRELLAQKLFTLYQNTSSSDWPWFENTVTYSNAKLSQAMIVTGLDINNPNMLECGLNSLQWLAHTQSLTKNCFRPIGTEGFYIRNGKPAAFDQQPIEAYSMISACLEAYRTTKEKKWFDYAQRSFEWFLGRNDLGLPLYDVKTGGCQDALHIDRVNQNQGAESTLAFNLSLIEMIESQKSDAK